MDIEKLILPPTIMFGGKRPGQNVWFVDSKPIERNHMRLPVTRAGRLGFPLFERGQQRRRTNLDVVSKKKIHNEANMQSTGRNISE